MLEELEEESYNFLTGALSNAETKQMVDAKWKSIALTKIPEPNKARLLIRPTAWISFPEANKNFVLSLTKSCYKTNLVLMLAV